MSESKSFKTVQDTKVINEVTMKIGIPKSLLNSLSDETNSKIDKEIKDVVTTITEHILVLDRKLEEIVNASNDNDASKPLFKTEASFMTCPCEVCTTIKKVMNNELVNLSNLNEYKLLILDKLATSTERGEITIAQGMLLVDRMVAMANDKTLRKS